MPDFTEWASLYTSRRRSIGLSVIGAVKGNMVNTWLWTRIITHLAMVGTRNAGNFTGLWLSDYAILLYRRFGTLGARPELSLSS